MARLLDEFLNERFDQAKKFLVNQPCKMTVSREGRFTTEPYIGDEELSPVGAYYGKKKDLILKFSVWDAPATTKWIEMSVHQANERLDHFQSYLDKLVVEYGKEGDELVATSLARELAELDELARVEADPIFGSW